MAKNKIKNKVSRISIREQFKEAKSFISESKNYMFFATFIFILSGIIGFSYYTQFGFLGELLKKIVSQTDGLGWFGMIVFILQNNALSSFFAIIFGIFFGIFPLFNSFANGIILGYVLRLSWNITGISEFWRLLPHGVFELPAIFISLGLGMKLGLSIFNIRNWGKFHIQFYKAMNSFLFVVIPLIIIAAIIEGTLIVLLR